MGERLFFDIFHPENADEQSVSGGGERLKDENDFFDREERCF